MPCGCRGLWMQIMHRKCDAVCLPFEMVDLTVGLPHTTVVPTPLANVLQASRIVDFEGKNGEMPSGRPLPPCCSYQGELVGILTKARTCCRPHTTATVLASASAEHTWADVCTSIAVATNTLDLCPRKGCAGGSCCRVGLVSRDVECSALDRTLAGSAMGPAVDHRAGVAAKFAC
jgi:hypothetical protein